jgi:hypothetical protein
MALPMPVAASVTSAVFPAREMVGSVTVHLPETRPPGLAEEAARGPSEDGHDHVLQQPNEKHNEDQRPAPFWKPGQPRGEQAGDRLQQRHDSCGGDDGDLPVGRRQDDRGPRLDQPALQPDRYRVRSDRAACRSASATSRARRPLDSHAFMSCRRAKCAMIV